MKNRDFIYNGIKYHLNDNIYKNEFEGKYKLLFFSEGWQRWQQIGTFDTKKAAIEYVRENSLYI